MSASISMAARPGFVVHVQVACSCSCSDLRRELMNEGHTMSGKAWELIQARLAKLYVETVCHFSLSM